MRDDKLDLIYRLGRFKIRIAISKIIEVKQNNFPY